VTKQGLNRRAAWSGAFADPTGAIFKDIAASTVTLTGSVFTTPIVGTDAVWAALRTAASIYDDLQFTDSYDTPDRTFLQWHGHALGHAVTGVTVLETDDDDRITEVRIHQRPLPALLAFSAEMAAASPPPETNSKDRG
jgi:hypothetical protein